MDEPYGALDESTREDLQIFILELWEKYKKTIIFVTHDLKEALFLGSRIVVLSQFWKSDLPVDGQEGARIVFDQKLDPHGMSTKVKETKAFNTMVQIVLNEGFNPMKRRHVDNFNLTHPDSFQSLTVEESHTNGHFHAAQIIGRDPAKAS